MQIKYLLVLPTLVASLLCGCTQTKIAEIQKDTYLVVETGGTAMTLGSVKVSALSKVKEIAQKRGKEPQITSIREGITPGPFDVQYPTVEVQFRLVNFGEAQQNAIISQPLPQSASSQASSSNSAAALERLRQIHQENARSDAALSAAIIANPPRIEVPPGSLQTATAPNQSTRPVPQNAQPTMNQLPSGVGAFPTGRTQAGPDGSLWREMRDVNGATYWTK